MKPPGQHIQQHPCHLDPKHQLIEGRLTTDLRIRIGTALRKLYQAKNLQVVQGLQQGRSTRHQLHIQGRQTLQWLHATEEKSRQALSEKLIFQTRRDQAFNHLLGLYAQSLQKIGPPLRPAEQCYQLAISGQLPQVQAVGRIGCIKHPLGIFCGRDHDQPLHPLAPPALRLGVRHP